MDKTYYFDREPVAEITVGTYYAKTEIRFDGTEDMFIRRQTVTCRDGAGSPDDGTATKPDTSRGERGRCGKPNKYDYRRSPLDSADIPGANSRRLRKRGEIDGETD